MTDVSDNLEGHVAGEARLDEINTMTEDPSVAKPVARRQHRRPLRLLDLMALVAAVALTLISPSIMKETIPADMHFSFDRRQYVIYLTSLVLFWWTSIFVALAIIESRSNLRRNCRRAGYAALFAVAAVFLYLCVQQLVFTLVIAGVIGWSPSQGDYYHYRYFCASKILELAADTSGASVATVWLILALTKAGRKLANWFDWLGCVVGVIWIVWGLTNYLVWSLPIPWLYTYGIQ